MFTYLVPLLLVFCDADDGSTLGSTWRVTGQSHCHWVLYPGDRQMFQGLSRS